MFPSTLRPPKWPLGFQPQFYMISFSCYVLHITPILTFFVKSSNNITRWIKIWSFSLCNFSLSLLFMFRCMHMFKHYAVKACGEWLISGKGTVIKLAAREEISPLAITPRPAFSPSPILGGLSPGRQNCHCPKNKISHISSTSYVNHIWGRGKLMKTTYFGEIQPRTKFQATSLKEPV
jgi:hypothetical protein